MSTVVVSAVTVTADQTVVVVTSTIAASSQSNTDVASSGSALPTSVTQSSGSAPTASRSNAGDRQSHHSIVPALAGGILGGLALLAFLIVLACLIKRRSRAKQGPSPFPDSEAEKTPRVMAGLPPNPSGDHHTASIAPLGAVAPFHPPSPSSSSHAPVDQAYSTPNNNRHSYISIVHSPQQNNNRHSYINTGYSEYAEPMIHNHRPPSDSHTAMPEALPYTRPAPALPLGAARPNYSHSDDVARVAHDQASQMGSEPMHSAPRLPSLPVSSPFLYSHQPV